MIRLSKGELLSGELGVALALEGLLHCGREDHTAAAQFHSPVTGARLAKAIVALTEPANSWRPSQVAPCSQ